MKLSVVQHPKEGTSQSSQSTQSILTQDELLIELVRTRRGLGPFHSTQ